MISPDVDGEGREISDDDDEWSDRDRSREMGDGGRKRPKRIDDGRRARDERWRVKVLDALRDREHARERERAEETERTNVKTNESTTAKEEVMGEPTLVKISRAEWGYREASVAFESNDDVVAKLRDRGRERTDKEIRSHALRARARRDEGEWERFDLKSCVGGAAKERERSERRGRP